MIAIPRRRVISGLNLPTCVIPIRESDTQTIKVDFMSCCIKKIDPCIAQGADKVFSFVDRESVDYSLASEITFDVWENVTTGANLLSKSLTGGSITLVNNYTFTLSVTDVESGAMTKGRKHAEAWVTMAGGDRQCVGKGPFTVVDTRKYD